MSRGQEACPNRTVAAEVIEAVAVEKLRELLREGQLESKVCDRTRASREQELAALAEERHALHRELCRLDEAREDQGGASTRPAAERQEQRRALEERISKTEGRIHEIDRRSMKIDQVELDRKWVGETLQDFDGLWKSMAPQDQSRLVHALVKRVEIDVPESRFTIELQPPGAAE